MKQMVSYLCCTTVISMLCVTNLNAETEETLLATPKACTKEELMTFFPQQVVQYVLKKAHIPQEQASGIAADLSQKDRELAKIVEEKAAKLDPNPFKDLSQRDLAIKIYRETLYEVFAQVLKSHGITNEDQIQTLLDEMQAAKSKLFIECIRQQQVKSSPLSPSS